MPPLKISISLVLLVSLCPVSRLEQGESHHKRLLPGTEPHRRPSSRHASLTLDDLQPGDVILAKGQTGASHAVEAISRNADAWTHAGLLAAIDRDAAFMIHATPAFVGGPGSGVERVSLSTFLADQNVLHAAALRPSRPTAGRSAAAYAERLVGRGIRFDQGFDLRTRADLYCTELVQRAYLEGADLDLTKGQSISANFLFEQADIILPDHLARSTSLRFIGDLK